jgi:dCTP deaminase
VTEGASAFSEAPLGAVLTDVEIRRLVEEAELISEFVEGSLSGASYDLRLGHECFTRGEHRMLSVDSPSHRLGPGQFILLTSLECLRLPDDVVGRAGLISRWAQRGLISLFSPQIDPGFQGRIVVPLFNAGDGPVTLKLGETMFTVEFARTTGCASVSWVKTHAPLMSIPAGVEVHMARPDLDDITRRLDELAETVTALQATLSGYQIGTGERKMASGTTAQWIAVVIAVVALVAVIALGVIQIVNG